ncbi:hypothetical protein [Devosia sp. 66-22]|uniref:hypothetical protein n=1 Tax=Devosia sp. 66-22 TaxID=1895753 RepID=UPI002604C4BC|nr:hypothetical protein [Devosia sp. 66-22]
MVLAAKLTSTLDTPSMFFTVRLIVAAQLTHDIPVTGTTIVVPVALSEAELIEIASENRKERSNAPAENRILQRT